MLKNDFESTNFANFEEVVHNFGRSDYLVKKCLFPPKSLIHKINALFVLYIFDNFNSWQNVSQIHNKFTK